MHLLVGPQTNSLSCPSPSILSKQSTQPQSMLHQCLKPVDHLVKAL